MGKFIDIDRLGWYSRMKSDFIRNGGECSVSAESGNRDGGGEWISAKVEHDVGLLIKKIFKMYDFSDDIEKNCKRATIRLRKALVAYFGHADYGRYVVSANVSIDDDDNVSAELSYSNDMCKSKNAERWSYSDARREIYSGA